MISQRAEVATNSISVFNAEVQMHGVQEKLGQNHGRSKFDATYVNTDLETDGKNIIWAEKNAANGGNTTKWKNKVRQSSNPK
jgi:surface antigen